MVCRISSLIFSVDFFSVLNDAISIRDNYLLSRFSHFLKPYI